MKVLLIFVAVLGLSNGGVFNRSQNKDINQDLQDFIDLLPKQQILDIIVKHLDDPEIQAVIEFILSDEFKGLVVEVEAIPEYEKIMSFLEDLGLPVRDWVKKLHDFLGISRDSVKSTSSKSLTAVIDEIIAILPIEKIKALYNDKLQNSPDFKKLIDGIKSPTFKAFVDALVANPRIQEIYKRLKEMGVDVDAFLELLKKIFGFQYLTLKSSKNLMDDLQDFVDLLPKDEIEKIILSHITDPDIIAVIQYILSDDFKKLVIEVEAIPEYEAIMSFLESLGLPVRDWVQKLHDFLGISRASVRPTSSRSLTAVIDEIIAILPIEKIKALYNDKLQNSPDFKKLIDGIKSPTFKAFVDALVANPKIQEIYKKLKEMGVDVDAFLELLKKIFGFQYVTLKSSRNLMDDLQDFVNLLPKDEIEKIILSHITDPDIIAVIQYILSDDFKKLVIEVEAIPEYEAIMSFLESLGLPVRDWVQKLHDFLGISRASVRPTSSRSLTTVIDEIIAILPIEKIKALYNEKLQNSPDFKKLIDGIKSPTFKAFVDALVSNPRIQEIYKKLKEMGVDVDAFLELLKKIFGFQYLTLKSSRNLMDDLQDFINLLPNDEIEKIILSHLNDPDIIAVIQYIFSDDFKKLVLEVEAIQEYEAVIAFLEDLGLPARDFVQKLHDFLGISRVSIASSSTKSLQTVIDEVIAILPIDEIKALYNEKLQSSPEFKKMIEGIKSPTFKAFVEALKANPRIQEIYKTIKAMGVDVDAFLELLKKIFGFEY